MAKSSAQSVAQSVDGACQHESDDELYEIVCPDGRVRDYLYFDRDDAESTAEEMTEERCNLFPEPIELATSLPPCPEGHHTVRIVRSPA